MKTYHIFWICVLSFTQGDVNIYFYDKNVDTLPGNPTVKIVESDNLLLNCTSFYGEKTSFTWTKDNIFLSSNPIIKIERINVIDAGQYMCEAIRVNSTTSKTVSDKKFVDVDVLYAPSTISVEVPPSVLWPEEITLSANVRANPEPTYEWRNARPITLLSRNKTYNFSPYESFYIQCIVQNRLIPTLGDSKIGIVSRTWHIKLHVKAVISSINHGHYSWVTQGQPLELTCIAGGYPEPTVWWTKTGDESFLSEGNRYLVPAANKSHAGKYICHAENNVRPANQSTLTIKVSEEVQVNIRVDSTSTINPTNLSCSPDDCKGVCSTTESTVRSKVEPCTCTSTTNPTHEEKSDFRNEPTFIGLLFALCLFVIAFMVSVSLNIYSYVLRRKLKPENNVRNDCPRIGFSTTMTTLSSEPVPPSQYTTLDHHYTDLTHYDQIHSTSRRSDEEDRDGLAFMTRQPSVNSYLNPVNSSQFT